MSYGFATLWTSECFSGKGRAEECQGLLYVPIVEQGLVGAAMRREADNSVMNSIQGVLSVV